MTRTGQPEESTTLRPLTCNSDKEKTGTSCPWELTHQQGRRVRRMYQKQPCQSTYRFMDIAIAGVISSCIIRRIASFLKW